MARRVILYYNIALIVVSLIALTRYWQLKSRFVTYYHQYQHEMRQTSDINGLPSLDPVPSFPDGYTPTKLTKPHDHDIDDIISGPVEQHKHKKPATDTPEIKCDEWEFCNTLQDKWRIVAGQTWGKAERNTGVQNEWESHGCDLCYPKPQKEQHRHTKPWTPATGFGGRNTMSLVFNRQIDMKRRSSQDTWFGILLPMTTAFGLDVRDYTELIFWEKLWPSFLEFTSASLADAKNPYVYTFLIGYDNGDPILDDPKQMSLIYKRMQDNLKSKGLPGWKVGVMAYALNDTHGAPSWAVSHIAQAAYDMGVDYMYQINDDTAMASPGWEEGLTSVLQRSHNLGVTGPKDANNHRILTQSFVHRTHVAIFDCYFDGAFKNWFSDDWLSSVYTDRFTYRDHGVRVVHHIQKSRYEVDEDSRGHLQTAITNGQTKIKTWLKAHPLQDVNWN